jgi:hypothetical protein
MSTTTTERVEVLIRLDRLGISGADAQRLRRIALTLHRWFERECGIDGGCIERDEITKKTYWLNSETMRRYWIPDRETGAYTRLASIMARYPRLIHYVQGDCRGASLYILTKAQAGTDKLDSIYSRGIAVY